MPNIRPLNSELQLIAEKELNENPLRIDQDLEVFREWISKQAHLKGRTTDQHLIAFLRGTKYNFEKSKLKYDLYYTIRSANPDIFEDRDPISPKNLELIRKGLILPLRKTVSEGSPRIIIVRKTAYNPDDFTIWQALRIFTMMIDLCLLSDDNFVVAGQLSLSDMKGTSFGHMFQMSPRFAKTATSISQDACPVRVKGSHYVNTPTGFQTVFNLFKPFLSDKTKQRIFVHGNNFEEVNKFIPKELLPKEYGGEDGTVQELIDYWEKELIRHREYFTEDSLYGVDESKRLLTPKPTDGELFGTEGTFRKLNIE